MALPADTPSWLVILVGALSALAAWFAAQVWPVVRKKMEATTEAELQEAADERKWRREMDERHIKAQEVTASALEGIRGTLSVMQFQISDIREHVGMARGPRLQARERGKTEGERGE